MGDVTYTDKHDTGKKSRLGKPGTGSEVAAATGADSGSRTRLVGLGSQSFTDKLYPHTELVGKNDTSCPRYGNGCSVTLPDKLYLRMYNILYTNSADLSTGFVKKSLKPHNAAVFVGNVPPISKKRLI